MRLIFPLLVLVFAGAALYIPSYFLWPVPFIVPLLGVIMFGMGITLTPKDFSEIIKEPKLVLIGLSSQYILMAGIAYLIVKVLDLPPGVAIGVILVGTCPGGTASNVMTFIAKGDLALSVSMTACSTLFAPILTPMLTLILAGESFHVNYIGMFASIVKIVILPVILGMIANKLFKKHFEIFNKVMPLVSMTAIIVIITGVVAINSKRIFDIAGMTVLAVVIHNALGLSMGYFIAKFFKFNPKQCRTLSLEVGLQNSGLATSLAKIYFTATPEAMVPAAFFSVWHNISGAVMASYWSMKDNKDDNHEKK